jgi:hypothetical protein
MTAILDGWAASAPATSARDRERRTATLLRAASIALFFAIWDAAVILNAKVF